MDNNWLIKNEVKGRNSLIIVQTGVNKDNESEESRQRKRARPSVEHQTVSMLLSLIPHPDPALTRNKAPRKANFELKEPSCWHRGSGTGVDTD